MATFSSVLMLMFISFVWLIVSLSSVTTKKLNHPSDKAFIRLTCDDSDIETAVAVGSIEQGSDETITVTCGPYGNQRAYKVTFEPVVTGIQEQNATARDGAGSWGLTRPVWEDEAVNSSSIQPLDRSNSTKLLVEVDDDHVNVFKRENALLQCKVHQTNPATDYIVTWYHYDKVVDLSGNQTWQLENGSLLMKDLKKSDEGVYSCEVQTLHETYSKQIKLVVVEMWPRWEEMGIDVKDEVPRVTNVTVNHYGRTALKLEWQPEQKNKKHDKVMAYIVRYYNSNNISIRPVMTFTVLEQIMLTGLEPDTNYTIYITAFAGYRMSFPMKLKIATKRESVKPDAPAIFVKTELNPYGSRSVFCTPNDRRCRKRYQINYDFIDTRVSALVKCVMNTANNRSGSSLETQYRKMGDTEWKIAHTHEPEIRAFFYPARELYYPESYQVRCVAKDGSYENASPTVDVHLNIPLATSTTTRPTTTSTSTEPSMPDDFLVDGEDE